MRSLAIHCLQHVSFEGPAYISDWTRQNGHALSVTRCDQEPFFPSPDQLDWLIIMGGPMGVYQEKQFAWLPGEKQLIRAAIRAEKTIIGICLGAQLIAEALGAKVYPNSRKEIGWFPVSLTAEGRSEPLFESFPDVFPALHWHGDTFDLPSGSKHIMKTDGCQHQAFLYGHNILGLQFHLETTPGTLRDLIAHGSHELVSDTFVQSKQRILTEANSCHQINHYLKKILNRLAHDDSEDQST